MSLEKTPLLATSHERKTKLNKELNLYVSHVIESLPATERHLQEVCSHQDEDKICLKLKEFCREGWPEKHKMNDALQPYWQCKGEITVQQGILMKADLVIIPSELRLEVLDKIHNRHLGTKKCQERTKRKVWWPGLSRQIEELVQECPNCIMTRRNHAEPMIPFRLPKRPWQKVGTDLFHWKGQEFVLVADYFSRYCEIGVLHKSTSQEVINHLKAIFTHHGIPETIVSDNGAQYSSGEFSKFAHEWGFTQIKSSPNYPQSKSEAERMVQTMKNLPTKAKDPYKAMLASRATPLENGYSPAGLSMGRRLRTTLPATPSKLAPKWPELDNLREKEDKIKGKQTSRYNKCHAARELSPLSNGDRVYIPDRKENTVVVNQSVKPSYFVMTNSNVI